MGPCMPRARAAPQAEATECDRLRLRLKQQMQRLEQQIGRHGLDADRQRQLAKQAVEGRDEARARYHMLLRRACLQQQQGLVAQHTALRGGYEQLKSVENIRAVKGALEDVNRYLAGADLQRLQCEMQEAMLAGQEQDAQIERLQQLAQRLAGPDADVAADLALLEAEVAAEAGAEAGAPTVARADRDQQARPAVAVE